MQTINKKEAQHYGHQIITLGKEIVAYGEDIVEKSTKTDSDTEIVEICDKCRAKIDDARLLVQLIEYPLWAVVILIIIGLIFGGYAITELYLAQSLSTKIVAIAVIITSLSMLHRCVKIIYKKVKWLQQERG